ncbi:MAG: glycosyltransferase family 2 protein [Candidatus Shapirobacteria bacterium]|jgi:glycosyltransferase involved in cell wall biosynthesis
MKTNLLPGLSVFFPCYNEEKNIANTVNKSLPIIKSISKNWEIIIINDGSKDKTGEVVLALQKLHPDNIKIITHNPNRGYGGALKSGLYNSRYPWIVFTDADGQFDFTDIHALLEKQHETQADIVIGYYLGRKVPFYRIWGSKLWQLAVFLLFGLKVTDIDCGFKLINQKVVKAIPMLQAERGPFITSEFLIHAKKAGFKICETGVHHFSRQEGEATGAKLNVILAGFKDLFSLWYHLTFAKTI